MESACVVFPVTRHHNSTAAGYMEDWVERLKHINNNSSD